MRWGQCKRVTEISWYKGRKEEEWKLKIWFTTVSVSTTNLSCSIVVSLFQLFWNVGIRCINSIVPTRKEVWGIRRFRKKYDYETEVDGTLIGKKIILSYPAHILIFAFHTLHFFSYILC